MKITLTALIHGSSGVGKSWLADTAPAPRLILDAEGRAKYTPSGPKVSWDPRSGGPPVYDGTWETCVVSVPDFETLTLVLQWLRSGQHPFVSVVVDSLMEAQKRCIDLVAGTSSMETQDWGTLLRRLEALVRQYRDLTLVEENPVCVVLLLVGSRTGIKSGKQEPLLQGQLADTVPYYLDVVGYLFKQPLATDPPTFQRVLLVDELPGYVAKDGTGRLPGPAIAEPNISTLYELLKPAAPAPIAAVAPTVEGGVTQ